VPAELPRIAHLDELADLIANNEGLYLRWSRGPEADAERVSKDELTGVELPGLSASPLAVEPWWGDRGLRLWAARRLYDYQHLRERRRNAEPWVLRGEEVGRGPDNEPLVRCHEALAWIEHSVVEEANRLIDEQQAEWGPLDRSA
jgi:hypothetical protein